MVGDSIPFWAGWSYNEIMSREPQKFPALRRLDVEFMEVRGMKIDRLIPFLNAKLDTMPLPTVVIVHCGTNDVHENVSLPELVEKVAFVCKELITIAKKRGFSIVWSNVLPRLHFRGMDFQKGTMFITNINVTTQFCFVAANQKFLLHPGIHFRRPMMYRFHKGKADPIHLSPMGYQLMFFEMDQLLNAVSPPKPLMAEKIARNADQNRQK